MKKHILFILCFIQFTLCTSCGFLPDNSKPPDGWYYLDLSSFKIFIPSGWKYKDPGVQEDSFVGHIIGRDVLLSFDCSEMGYATHLIKTEQEYLKSKDWWDHSTDLPYWGTKTNVAPTDLLQKKQFPKADFIATLTYQGKTIYTPIEIPAEIKASNIQLDSNANYVFKTIWPKIAGKGMTGIYIHSRKSTFNFQMSANNLSTKDQEMALKAFKTISFK